MRAFTSAKDIGAALRARRKALGLTQAAAAARIGSTQRWVSQVENGKDRAEIGAILRLAAALELPLVAGATVSDAAPEPVDVPPEPLRDGEPERDPAARVPRPAQRRAAYRAFVDAYRAAFRSERERLGGFVPAVALRAVAHEARRTALAAWVGPRLEADRARIRSAAVRARDENVEASGGEAVTG